MKSAQDCGRMEEHYLSKEHKAALQKLQDAVSDVIPPDDTNYDIYYFLAWLKEHNFNPKKTEPLLRASLEWRKKHKIDELVDIWTPPEVLTKYLPHGMIGNDKEGSPILIFPLKDCDVRGILQSVSKEDFMYYIWYVVEKSKRDMRRLSKQFGHNVSQHNVIIDVEGFDMKSMLWKPAIDTVRAVIGPAEANYPDMVKKVFIINAPRTITFFYNMFKPFISASSKKRVSFMGTDRSKWAATLLETIDADQLPKYWGGTCIDSDGDIYCQSKIILGKKVPQSYYVKGKEAPNDTGDQVLTVGKGESSTLEFEVKEKHSMLRWTFRTDDYDIGFKVNHKSKEVVSYSRVDSHLIPVEGEIRCQETGIYVITFDNSYSKMRSKNVYHSIEVYPAD